MLPSGVAREAWRSMIEGGRLCRVMLSALTSPKTLVAA
jgi:hypothetical protein